MVSPVVWLPKEQNKERVSKKKLPLIDTGVPPVMGPLVGTMEVRASMKYSKLEMINGERTNKIVCRYHIQLL